MIERLEGKVESVSIIKRVGTSLDLCEIQIDFDSLKIFYDYNELVQFIGKEVLYTTRPDVIDSREELVICELVELSTIQTVQAIENIKLVPEGNKRTICNFDSKKIRFGDYYPNVVAMLSGFTLGTSSKATWYDLSLIDMYSREFTVKRFVSSGDKDAYELELNGYVGHYITFDLSSTKYGNQTKEIFCLPTKVELSPEVIVAKEIITNLIQSDDALKDYNTRFDFVNTILGLIDGEPGYAIVKMASELYMVNAIDSISTDLDIRAMRRAIICSRGHMLPKKVEYSKALLNTTKASQIPALKADKELMLMMDVFSGEEPSSTKLTYIQIRKLVDNIIKIRRGINDEKAISTYDDITDNFGGLL